MLEQTAEGYNGAAPFPDAEPPAAATAGRIGVAVTAAIAGLPFAGLVAALWLAWGHGVGLADMLLMAGLYVVTGLGVTVGYHRCFTHRSFTAAPALRAVLAVAGSMSFQGGVIGWVATHRRHHAFADRPGDPHSPYRYGTSLRGLLRGLVHAHLGWMFRDDPTPADRYAPDLQADPVMRAVSNAFPALSVLSLAVPFGLGWAIGGTAYAALTGLLWAGLVRVTLLQHVTWSVNSLCHLLGNRPFTTRRFDRATNLWPLALLSFGESWHNLHHSDPTCARHGVDRFQIDLSAEVIKILERAGWARDVRWPAPSRLDSRRRPGGDSLPGGHSRAGGRSGKPGTRGGPAVSGVQEAGFADSGGRWEVPVEPGDVQYPVRLRGDRGEVQKPAQRLSAAAGTDEHGQATGVTKAHLGQVYDETAGAGPEQAQEPLAKGRGAGKVDFAGQFGDGYAALGPGGHIQAADDGSSGVHGWSPIT